ncbi:MAG: SAM-dependent methyltransferase, partial [Flavobacteriales bacterium]
FIVKKIAFSDKGKEFNYEEKVKALALRDFEKYFINAGLVIKSVFGNYDLNPFDEDDSDRLILLAKKK